MKRRLLLATVAALTTSGTAGFAQNVEIQDVTPTENGVVIEADAGIGQVDAETPSPDAADNTNIVGVQEPSMAPVTEQLNGDFDPEAETATASDDTRTSQLDNVIVSDLLGTEVQSTDGEVVGEVEGVVKIGDEIAAVVGIGGFLGFGEREVALPLQDLDYSNGTLTLTSATAESLDEMPEHDAENGSAMPDNAAVLVYN